MSSRKWCITFVLTIILIALIYAGFNIVVDPFGVFGDKFFDWYSYDITNNPRSAKIAYLEKNDNYKKYDSYLIGCSSTSSFPKESLDKYFGGSWYNMIMYGADMLDVEQTTKYVVEEFGAKNIMINIFISNGTKYDEEEDNITKNMHAKLNGENLFSFYSRYAFLNTDYSFAKLDALKKDTYLTQPFDVFNVETGAYDKKVRDAEGISTLDEYYKAYEVFKNYPMQEVKMTKIDETVESIKRIKEYCNENNINLHFIMAPVYVDYLKYFDKEEVKEFHTKIAEVTDYWDFTTSSLTYEPRFFYDETHFRNDFGTMCLAKMSNNSKIYYPADVGEYVTKENVEEHVNKILSIDGFKIAGRESNYTCKLPILTFHSIVENPQEMTEVSPKKFEEVLKFIKDNGYMTVDLNDIYNYVYYGINFEKKPVLITFDDGYLNNYEFAFPLLKKYNQKAVIYTVGATIGSEGLYKDTQNKMAKHFNLDQAKEMFETGLVDIQSHTYDMHQWKDFELDRNVDENKIRENALKLENETEQEYIDYFENDIKTMRDLLVTNVGNKLTSISYPSGQHDTLSDVVVSQNGIKLTVTIEEGTNTIIKGLKQSLYNLKRNNIEEVTDLKNLFDSFSQ